MKRLAKLYPLIFLLLTAAGAIAISLALSAAASSAAKKGRPEENFSRRRSGVSYGLTRPVSSIPVVWRAKTDQKVVALTFDDGPDPRFTPRILDILKKNGIKASFFVVGANAERYPELVKREEDEGHLIGVHTWDHPHLTRISTRKIGDELDKTADIVFRITGIYPRYMRPPYGEMDKRVYRVIHSRGYRIVIWSTEFQDLRYPAALADASYVASRIRPGDIILGHDGRRSYRKRDVMALPYLITELKARGYRFATVDELLIESHSIPGKTVPEKRTNGLQHADVLPGFSRAARDVS